MKTLESIVAWLQAIANAFQHLAVLGQKPVFHLQLFFYTWWLKWAELDVLIGNSTGRCQRYVDADRADVSKWQREITLLNLNL